MIELKKIIKILKKNNIDFFTGVPDSILKELSIYLQNKKKKKSYTGFKRGGSCIYWNWLLPSKKKNVMYISSKFRTFECNESINFYRK